MSKFGLSNYKLFTCNQGDLVPCGIHEVLPGDVFKHSTSLFIRTTPLLAPVMHPVHATVHHWFVPWRLVWSDFEKWITGGEDGLQEPVYPTMTINDGNGYDEGSLADYLGIPPGVDDIVHSALPFRAYNLIYNENYRDQQLQTKVANSLASGADTTSNKTMQKRCWQKDRFTSSRPEPQLGPEVTIPLGSTAPVVTNNEQPTFSVLGQAQNRGLTFDGANQLQVGGSVIGPADSQFGNESGLFTDLSGASAASINDWREAWATQRFQENRNLYGGRYTEYLAALGVRAQDARLQRPEYLGGGKQTVQFSEVLQTAPAEISAEETPVGNMAGHGLGVARSRRYKYYFQEHGYVISLMSVKPVTMYGQGLHRLWNRRTKFDVWQPEFQHIGQDVVLNKEVYANPADGEDDNEFGYQNIYDDYRHIPSTVAGEFRSSLDMWNMFRKFSSRPALNAAFVASDPTDRIYSTGSSSHQLLVMAQHNLKASRLMDQYGNPAGL